MILSKMLQKKKNIKNNNLVFMYTTRSLKNIKELTSYSHTKILEYILAYILGFNNQFIKTLRIWPIFQKISKTLFCFLLVSGIANLYVRHIPCHTCVASRRSSILWF